jgi:hypothetical protein
MTLEQIRELTLAREHVRRLGPDLLSWSRAFRFEAGSHLDFDRFPFQLELYRAFGECGLSSVDVMKSAQCGVSAAAVSFALYGTDLWAANVLYVLPAGEDAEDFSDTRVRPAIEDSGYLRSRVVATDNKTLKKIGEAYLYFRGSLSERKTLSVPADVLILDEYDRLDQANIPRFRRRLAAPDSLKLERRFSNPSYPEDGIHRLYLQSDRRRWLVRCARCAAEAPLGWEEEGCHHVEEERAIRICHRCRSELDRAQVASGRWVAERPGAGPRGYHVSRLIVPDERIGELVANRHQRDEASMQTHYNFDLGLPYAPRGGSLSREAVLANRRDYTLPSSFSGSDRVTAGVDVGRLLHVRISRWLADGRAMALFVATIDSFEELGRLMDAYSVDVAAVDERPEERKARELARAFPGRVLLVRWSGEEQRDEVAIDRGRGLLVARRTAACDRLVAAFEAEQRLLPEQLPEGYLSQLTAPHRVIEENARGQKVARYRAERADDYFFAECHDLLAHEAGGVPPAGASGPAPVSIREQIRRRHWGPGFGWA